MNKAVFFDRDGVINYERGEYTYLPKDLIINEGIIPSLKKLQEHGFLLIIVSNQGGISKELYTKEQVEEVHQYLKDELKKHEIQLTEIYYCPHHAAFENCLCRKPKSLMLEKAIARFDIDNQSSYMIGDSERDITAAKKLGLNTIKIEPNENIEKYIHKIIIPNKQ
ncbi:MAG: D-glycero-D-manno-heptose 1,7-bisphosphate phosphatase [Bacteroidales bacterium]|nr:D-glycero-D-manno-heptose 1,7-bisphosphate phosphatase [Bacteroidales bacterium]